MTVLEVNASSPGDAQKALRRNPDIVSVTQLGIRLRILVPDDNHDQEELVQKRIEAPDVKADIRIIEASLEDVFVASTLASGDSDS